MPKPPTVEDVARLAGVSRQTVSNVLNAPDVVREATRERVRGVIADLGYRPHAAARRLRTRRSSTLGIHLDPYAGGVSGVVLDRFVHALSERASERGLRLLVFAARSPEDEIARMADLLDTAEVDAFVVTGTFRGDRRTGWLAERKVPFVSFGRPWGEDGAVSTDHRWVDVDGAAGTRQATRHALNTAGPRVGFLGWPPGSGTGDDRERGWRETPAGGSPRLVAEDAVGAARAVVAPLLGEVDALVCASDSLAMGAHLAAVAAGRGDFPVIGFDNTPAAEALGLSSVEQLPEQVAAGALELLLDADGDAVLDGVGAGHVLVEPRLVVR